MTKTLRDLRKVLDKRHDRKWLAKRMMAKRGDDVGKALAGSLMAAHDEDISLVGNYSHQSFGKASYVRRGDGKVAYQAGLQNHHMPTLRDAALGRSRPQRILFLLMERWFRMHWSRAKYSDGLVARCP